MIKTGNPLISIYTEMTPNPETMKFVANKLLYAGKSIDFPDADSAKPSPLATELFGFPFIRAVFIASNFVTLTKTPETDWQDVIPSIRQFLKDYLEEGKAVINEEEVVSIKKESSNEVLADDDDVVKRIKELLENYVKPAVEMDGGAIQFRSYEDGVVNLMLQGSCSGCPSSMITLKAGIEGMMKRMIPEVKEVIELIKEHGAFLATSHLSAQESHAVVEAAKDQGLDRIIISHARWAMTGLKLDDLKHFASLGCLIEFEYCLLTALMYFVHGETPQDPRETVKTIKEVGVGRCFISSDLGQLYSPLPVDGMRTFVAVLRRCGITPDEIRTMFQRNPADIAGLASQ